MDYSEGKSGVKKRIMKNSVRLALIMESLALQEAARTGFNIHYEKHGLARMTAIIIADDGIKKAVEIAKELGIEAN